MKSYMVTYDLIKRKDYPDLFKQLRSYNNWHCLGSSWIIKANKSAEDLYREISPHIDSDDKLLIIEVVRNAHWTGSFSKDCQSWLLNNL